MQRLKTLSFLCSQVHLNSAAVWCYIWSSEKYVLYPGDTRKRWTWSQIANAEVLEDISCAILLDPCLLFLECLSKSRRAHGMCKIFWIIIKYQSQDFILRSRFRTDRKIPATHPPPPSNSPTIISTLFNGDYVVNSALIVSSFFS